MKIKSIRVTVIMMTILVFSASGTFSAGQTGQQRPPRPVPPPLVAVPPPPECPAAVPSPPEALRSTSVSCPPSRVAPAVRVFARALPVAPPSPLPPPAVPESDTRITIRNTGQKLKYTDTRTLSGKVATGPGKSLSIDTSQARITVTGWSGNEVVVEAKIEVGSDNQEAVREFLEATELIVEPEGSGGRIHLRSPFEENLKGRSKGFSETLRNLLSKRRVTLSFSAGVDIKVPASQSLDIENAFGDVTVSGVTGRHDIKNESGEVKVEKCGGGIRLENSFARVSVTDFNGDVDVRNESGEVHLKNISGKADVRNSFRQVTFERVAGDLTVTSESADVGGTGVGGSCRIESSFKKIDVSDVTGNLDIRGESAAVTVDNARSDVTIESSFAPVKITNIGGALKVTTESAAVTVGEVGRNAMLRNSFRKVEASQVHGHITVECDSGPVTLREIDGDAVVVSSFGPVSAMMVKGSLDVKSESSSVNAADIGRTATISSSFAPIEIRRTGGEVKVNGESLRVLVEDPGGTVDVRNSSGYVILKGTRGSVLVRSDSSSVELSAVKSLPPGSVVDIRTSYKPITVTLPAGIELKITARSEYGRVQSDFPVYVIDTGEGRVRVESRDQGAPRPESDRIKTDKDVVVVRLETSTADIVIKKQQLP